MKKNNLTLVIMLFLGLLTGSVLSAILADISAISFLTRSITWEWAPKADLYVLRYDLQLMLNVNLFSVLGMVGAYWLFRKM
jgi:hypothetical protein